MFNYYCQLPLIINNKLLLLLPSVEAAEPVHKEGASTQGERGRSDITMMTF